MSHRREALERDIKSLQSNFNEILTSGHHYYTQELATHIKHINNALDNIKLDHEFQRGSKNWTKQFDQNEIQSNELNVQHLITQGQSLSRELNTCLHTTTVQNKEENQIRELHSWACDSLIGYLQALHPAASGSYARLDNLAHHLGVTDRYIGYRHNLTRGSSQPLNVHTVWADRKMPRATTAAQQQQPSTPDWKHSVHAYRHYGQSAGNAAQSSSVGSPTNNQHKLLGYMQPALQRGGSFAEPQRPMTTSNYLSQSGPYDRDHSTEVRKAGINLDFPGETEFMDRYQKPQELPYSPFTMNPQPDYTLTGRPLARLVPDTYPSEYMHSYVFPDSTKIEKYPWLRSW